MNWSYGLTTVPRRRDNLLPRTLKSLEAGGFGNPRLFVDGVLTPELYLEFGVPITVRYPRAGVVVNWILSAWELYVRNPNAERYALFQDDLVTYVNLRLYLEKCKYPARGYWNLYTFPQNQNLCPSGHRGWYPSNQYGRGAVALVFDRDNLRTVLGHQHMIGKVAAVRRPNKSVDGAIVSSITKSKGREFVHNPSLVQHIGDRSSLGNRRFPRAESFKGEDFDALELLK